MSIRQLPDRGYNRRAGREMRLCSLHADRAAWLQRAGYYGVLKLAREDDVFFRPGVHLLTMRAGQLVILQRRVRVEIFIDREACRRELRCGRASD